MKWFFRITALIFALFALAVLAGSLMPGTQVIERSAVVERPAADVFDTLNDLSTYWQWNAALPAKASIAYGQRTGAGASMAWEHGTDVGGADILQSVDPDLVLVQMQDGVDTRVMTFALADEGERTLVLAKSERDLGGFPFLARLSAKLGQGAQAARMDASLSRLAAAIPEA